MSDTPTHQATETDTPLQDFSSCHVGFVTVLEAALGLREMIVTAARSRSCAADMLKMFHDRLLAHHDDEERDLFPAVLRIAQPGEEADGPGPWSRNSFGSIARSRSCGSSWRRPCKPSLTVTCHGSFGFQCRSL